MQPLVARYEGAPLLFLPLQPATGGANLKVQSAVFLPLGEPEQISCRGDWNYRLFLHGFFFVDSGRRHIEDFEELPEALPLGDVKSESQIIKLWNRTLLREVVTPLLLPRRRGGEPFC